VLSRLLTVALQVRRRHNSKTHKCPYYWIYWIVYLFFPPFIIIFFSAHPFYSWNLVSIIQICNSWLLSWRGVSHTKFLLLLFFPFT
jgi:hypothetical protein